MIQNASLDITGRPLLRVLLPLPQATRDALSERGIQAPERVALLLREPTGREKKRFQAQAATLTPDDEASFTAGLMFERREDPETSREVFEELALDLTETALAQVQDAYLTGRWGDPKVIGAAVRRLKHQLVNAAYSAAATAPSESSPTTESGRGNADTSPTPS